MEAISGEWEAMLTSSRTARLAPAAVARATPRSSASVSPEITTWPGQLSLASTSGRPVSWLAWVQIARTPSAARPRIAAMAPGWRSPASFISRPRSRTRRSPSAKESALAAARAVISPRLCPATAAGRTGPATDSRARSAARLVMYSAGWVLYVSFRASAGPSQHRREKGSPSMSSACWKISRAAG